MWIKTRNILVLVTLLLSSFLLTSCGSSTSIEIKKIDSSQHEVDTQFKKAENLFDQGKSEKAYIILRKLADQGHAKSQNALGNGYEYGFWGDINLEQAKYWYTKAADQQYPGGIHNLGMLEFKQGHYKEALPYFQKGASLQSPDSMTLLGAYYSEGIVFEQDYKKALEYFYKAIDINFNNASALFNIGQAYYYGHGLQQDYQKAFVFYTKAADLDYSLAKIQLAEMYFSGKGVNKNVAKAIEIIQPVADLGDPKAQYNLKWYINHSS